MRRLTRAFSAPFDDRVDAEANRGAARDLAALLMEVANRFAIAAVELGVDMILDGRLAGFDGKRLPTPTQLGLAIRQAVSELADQARRSAPPALPEPDHRPTAEERARVRAMLEAFVAGMAARHRAEDRAAAEEARVRAAARAQRWEPPQDDEARMARLVRSRLDSGAAR